MNNTYLVEERSRDIGQFMVGRLLPFRKKRQVGPFTFIDHMGPAYLGNGKWLDVDQHPHIGLATLTYLFEGEVEHRDSTGATQVIKAGDIGYMHAGKAVSHTERTPAHLRTGERTMHGYQIWVALPREEEDSNPHFQYIPAKQLPQCEKDGLKLCIAAGEAFGMKSPLKVSSPLFMVRAEAREDVEVDLSKHLQGEIAIVVVSGEVEIEKQKIGNGQMLVSTEISSCPLKISGGTKLLFFGGEPLPEERFLYWNFVSSSKEKLEQAKKDWAAKKFPKVPGDESYIPLPS
ncbi:pirin family protein [Luteibaculum oceani]|uniref:Pirin family protein n=1 Tax=Luteibaculum oceani TaxID=1294296 RepID=A0A5C6VPP1_9FLAO|nr:pirin family protein [Luteibaculum oceani]TXC85258.1 pirin family protein [Luteibaculum oceani]